MKSEMNIEVVKFYPFSSYFGGGRLVGYADVVVGGIMKIRGIKLLKNRYGGLYIQMPSVDGHEIVEILSKDIMEAIRREVVDFYKSVVV